MLAKWQAMREPITPLPITAAFLIIRFIPFTIVERELAHSLIIVIQKCCCSLISYLRVASRL
jgi:hypothetical protein